MYNSMTSAVPRAKDNGKFRRGFLTSAAVNVTFGHALDENNAPTIANPTSVGVCTHTPLPYACRPQRPELRQNFVKFIVRADCVAISRPIKINPLSATIFTDVKT